MQFVLSTLTLNTLNDQLTHKRKKRPARVPQVSVSGCPRYPCPDATGIHVWVSSWACLREREAARAQDELTRGHVREGLCETLFVMTQRNGTSIQDFTGKVNEQENETKQTTKTLKFRIKAKPEQESIK